MHNKSHVTVMTNVTHEVWSEKCINDKEDESKVYYSLINHDNSIVLRAVNKKGEPIKCGHILTIEKSGFIIIMNGVSPDTLVRLDPVNCPLVYREHELRALIKTVEDQNEEIFEKRHGSKESILDAFKKLFTNDDEQEKKPEVH